MYIFSSLDRTAEDAIEIRGILDGKSVLILVDSDKVVITHEDNKEIYIDWPTK